MSVTTSVAANAYRIAQGLANRPDRGQSGAEAAKPDFAAMVKDSLGGLVAQGREAEQKSLAYASGRADVVDVVTAVAETGVALDTMVAVRDRVIQAYEEIMRMPI